MAAERITAGIAALVMARFALAASRRARYRYGAVADPLTVFLWVWTASIGLFAIPVIRYTPLGPHAWALVYGSILTFAAGCLLADRGRASKLRAPADHGGMTLNRDRLPVVWAIAVVLGLIGFLAFVRAAADVVGLSSVISDPAAIRAARRAGPAFDHLYGPGKVLTYFNQVAFVLWTVGLRTRSFRGRWSAARWLGAISIVPFVFTADRGVMAATVAWAGMLHLFWPRTVNYRRVLQIGAVGFVLAFVVFLAVGARYGSYLSGHPEIAAVSNIQRPGQGVIGYLYVTGNLPTFAQLTHDPLAPVTGGQMSILPIVKLVHAAGVPGTAPVGTGVFYPIPFEAFSNYGWLGTFWLDFRDAGVLLMPFLFAFGCTRIFVRFWRAPTLGWLWALSILMLVVAFSPLANELSTTFVWEHLMLAPVIGLLLAPTLAFRVRRLGLAAALGATAVAGAGLLALRASSTTKPPDLRRELLTLTVDAHVAYEAQGHFPTPQPLVTRLKVANPGAQLTALSSFLGPIPAAPTIGVFSIGPVLYMRTRQPDGQILEIHRYEVGPGFTFGPGTSTG